MRELIFFPIANTLPRLRFAQKLRHVLLRAAGMRIAGRCNIMGPMTVRPVGCAGNIRIGAGTTVNTPARFGVPVEEVWIGDNVLIGSGVSFETVRHGLYWIPGKGRGDVHGRICVEDEAWIGAGAIILGGVTVGRGATVGAGAVVTRDVPPYTVVVGVPAKVIRELDPAGARAAPETMAETG
ncbi:hypothetical protein IP88_15335 [alpha proteobacterium AAP81b]|nr:hypothetical protein IP88_15335 [alpha proteobacterium AAP81b]